MHTTREVVLLKALRRLLVTTACLIVVTGGYWATEYLLVREHATRMTIPPNKNVKVASIQLLGNYPLGQVLRPHSWRVTYEDLRFQDARGKPFGLLRTVLFNEPRFGQFLIDSVHPTKGPSLEMPDEPIVGRSPVDRTLGP